MRQNDDFLSFQTTLDTSKNNETMSFMEIAHVPFFKNLGNISNVEKEKKKNLPKFYELELTVPVIW